jgi:threonyl-tRNA synthetase
LNAKVRNAQLQKIPYIVVVGSKEEAASTIAVRTREGKQQFDVKLEGFVSEVKSRCDKLE